MATRSLEMISNVACMFSADGALDEPAFTAHLQRMADANVGIFVGSPGSGESNYLSKAEFRRTCQIAVDVGRNRVPVYSMTPELHDIDLMLEFAQIAAECGVDQVQLFQLMGGHGMVPTIDEQSKYWRTVLGAIDHAVAISIHAVAGYLAPPDIVGQVCHEHPNVRTVYMYGATPKYLLEVRDATDSEIRLGVHLVRAVHDLALGATIVTGTEPNLIPKTCRALIDTYAAGNMFGLEQSAQRIQRLGDAIAPWGKPNSRQLKMALRVLGLPGGTGGVRSPLQLPAQSELERMASALEQIGVRDWEGWPAATS